MVPLRPARRLLLLGFWLGAALAQATPDSAPRADEAQTDFLEFLGSWHNDERRWVDPFETSDDLSSSTPPRSNVDQLDPEKRARRQSKGLEPDQSPDTPREPRRMQTGP